MGHHDEDDVDKHKNRDSRKGKTMLKKHSDSDQGCRVCVGGLTRTL